MAWRALEWEEEQLIKARVTREATVEVAMARVRRRRRRWQGEDSDFRQFNFLVLFARLQWL